MLRRAVLWLPVAVLVAWAVIRLGGLDRGYPLVPLIAFTPYVAAAGIVVIAAAVFLGDWPAAILATAAVAALAAVVVPRGIPRSPDLDGAALRVLTVNVRAGSVPAGELVDQVELHGVDLLSVQELTPEFARSLRRAGLERELPHAVVRARPGARGTGLYGRMRLRALRPLQGVHAQAVAEAQGVGRVIAVHPPPPTRREHRLWRAELEHLPRADLLAGDFNATLDHSVFRRVLDDGYEDAAAAVGAGLRGTWPANRAYPAAVAIDHVLVRRRWQPRRVKVIPLPRTDHRAVLAELVRRR